jgi:membrane associated rhomboid family serine protease
MKSIWASPVKTILLSGGVAGTLDILGAFFVYSLLMKKIMPLTMLQGIASGVFKAAAFNGGASMAAFGLLFHFIIAFSFAIFYFLMYPLTPFTRKYTLISGLLYGIFIWGIMNLVVLPLVFAHPAPVEMKSFLIGASILMVMIGLPVSLITHRYYSTKVKRV